MEDTQANKEMGLESFLKQFVESIHKSYEDSLFSLEEPDSCI